MLSIWINLSPRHWKGAIILLYEILLWSLNLHVYIWEFSLISCVNVKIGCWVELVICLRGERCVSQMSHVNVIIVGCTYTCTVMNDVTDFSLQMRIFNHETCKISLLSDQHIHLCFLHINLNSSKIVAYTKNHCQLIQTFHSLSEIQLLTIF